MKKSLISMCSTRNLSFSFFRKSAGDKCEKTECKTKPQEKYVVEKCCSRSIFETWSPKIPELTGKNFPTIETSMRMPYQKKICVAGPNKKTRCDIEAMAKERVKMNHPKWIHHCPPLPKNKIVGPVPALQAGSEECKKKGASKQESKKDNAGIKSLRKKCDPPIPESNWDIDGKLH